MSDTQKIRKAQCGEQLLTSLKKQGVFSRIVEMMKAQGYSEIIITAKNTSGENGIVLFKTQNRTLH